MNILVTGGAGFIGSHTLDALAARGDRTALLDDFNDFYSPDLKRRQAVTTGAKIFEVDLRNRDAVFGTIASFQPDAIIHLAARAGVRPSIQDPQLYIDTNITGTLHILEAAVAHKVQKIVLASSSSVYGNNTKIPFAEDDRLDSIISPYALTKQATETLARMHATRDGLAVAALRFFTVYGPRQRPDLAIAKFLDRVATGSPIELYGDGSSSRDYTYVDDIVSGILAALDRLQPGFRVYNLGGDQPVSLSDLVTAIEKTVNRTANIKRLPPQEGDVDRTWADLARAREELNYTPSIHLEAGLQKQWEWQQAQTVATRH